MRGVAYTLIAVILTSVVLTFVLTAEEPQRTPKNPVSIVQSMNSIVDAFDEDLERGLYISAYRTVIAQIEKITNTGVFITDLQSSFEEGMLNNTIESEPVSALEGSGLIDWLNRTRTIYAQRGYRFEYEIIELRQYQEDPWRITAELTLAYNLTDAMGSRGYEREVTTYAYIPIEGLEDPLYYVASLGRISNIVESTEERDLPTLINASETNSRYVLSNKSPSYLMRLTENHSASANGIESIMNGQRFLIQGIGTYFGSSSIDTVAFSGSAHDPRCMSGTPSWFRLDVDRLGDYSGSVNVTC